MGLTSVLGCLLITRIVSNITAQLIISSLAPGLPGTESKWQLTSSDPDEFVFLAGASRTTMFLI